MAFPRAFRPIRQRIASPSPEDPLDRPVEAGHRDRRRGDLAELLETGLFHEPEGRREGQCQHRNLAELDTDVEADQRLEDLALRQLQLL